MGVLEDVVVVDGEGFAVFSVGDEVFDHGVEFEEALFGFVSVGVGDVGHFFHGVEDLFDVSF